MLPARFLLLGTLLTGPAAASIPGIPAPPIDHAVPAATPATQVVDSTDPACDDNGPGSVDVPLCSLPRRVAAGAVVEVRGGPYDLNGHTRIDLEGSPEATAVLRGAAGARPVIRTRHNRRLDIHGSWFVFEHLLLDQVALKLGCGATQTTCDESHRGVGRDLEVRHVQTRSGVTIGGSDMVLASSHIHHNQGDDRHGTTLHAGSRYVWILDNQYDHNGGDAIQFCHGCKDNPPHHVFIGGNTMTGDRENGVDLKYADQVVVAGNRLSGYRNAPKGSAWCYDDVGDYPAYSSAEQPFDGCYSTADAPSSGSDGAAIVVGSDGAPTGVWLLHNEISASEVGIRIEEAGSGIADLHHGTWLVGNVLHDLERAGIVLDKSGLPVLVFNNTFYGMDVGINQHWLDAFVLHIESNLFANVGTALRLEQPYAWMSAVLENNVFESSGAMPIHWGISTWIDSGATIDTLPGTPKSGNVLTTDADLVQPAAGDFRLATTSPAIAAGNDAIWRADAWFQALFDTEDSIAVDRDGSAPMAGQSAAGAYQDGITPALTVTIVPPADPEVGAGETVYLDAEVSGGTPAGTVNWRSSVDGDLASGTHLATTLSPGTHVVTASAVDTDGYETEDHVTLNVLAPPLAISLAVAETGPIVAGATVTVTAAATGAGTATEYKFQVAGSETSTAGPDLTTVRGWGPAPQFDWHTAAYVGANHLRVLVRDPAQGRERADLRDVVVIDAPVSLAMPLAGATLVADHPLPVTAGDVVTLTALPDGGDPATLRYRWKMQGGPASPTAGTLMTVQSWSSDATFTWDTTDWTGVNRIRVSVADVDGNVITDEWRNVHVD